MDLFRKIPKHEDARIAIEMGFYPYFIPISGEQGPTLEINGKNMIMLGSNNYLGLTNHPEVKESAKKAIEKYGVGCTGSRFLNGTLDIHVELEEKLADFMGMESALIFSTGFQTNLGTISSMMTKDDFILSDSFNHASIIDGCRIAKGNSIIYKHNDLESLKAAFNSIPEKAGTLVATDGLFSMEGDFARLPEIIKMAKEHDSRVMVDDAHAIGVYGKRGRGTTEHFGVEADIIMGTFSKSLASIGGFVASTEEVIFHLKHSARPLIFSASPPPAAIATVSKALDIVMEEPERRSELMKNAEYFRNSLKKMGYNIGLSESQIIPVIVGDLMETVGLWKSLYDYDVFTNPVLYPATPPERSLIRNSIMSTHSMEDLDQALETYEKIGRDMGII